MTEAEISPIRRSQEATPLENGADILFQASNLQPTELANFRIAIDAAFKTVGKINTQEAVPTPEEAISIVSSTIVDYRNKEQELYNNSTPNEWAA